MDLLFLLIFIILFVGYFVYKKYQDKTELNVMVRASILFAFYTKGNMLIRVDRGWINKLYFDTFITLNAGPLFGEPITPGGSVLYRLELPFSTEGHLVGISKIGTTTKASIDYMVKNNLKKVELEGDFGNYFDLYCADGQERHARYIFDPSAMQFVVDFCAQHDWEIVYDELYFVISEDQEGGPILAKSVEFIKQIKPAIVKSFPTKEHIKLKTPYGEWRGKPMNCPICTNQLINKVHYLECPQGHGRLLHAQKLIGYRKGYIKAISSISSPKAITRNTDIKCPHCHNNMVQIQYATKGLIIDSCVKCPWRWLDSNELEKILPINQKGLQWKI